MCIHNFKQEINMIKIKNIKYWKNRRQNVKLKIDLLAYLYNFFSKII